AVTVLAGILFGIVSPQHRGHSWAVAVVMVAYSAFASWQQLRETSLQRVRVLTLVELVVVVGGIMLSGAFKSPFILTPLTGLLLAGYVWGRRATVGATVAGVIATISTIAIQSADAADQRAAAQIAVIFMLCGALGAFTRNLVVEIETQR